MNQLWKCYFCSIIWELHISSRANDQVQQLRNMVPVCICVIILSNHLNWLGWTMWKLLEGLLPSPGPSACCLKSNIRRIGEFRPFNTLLPCQQMFQSKEGAGIMWQGKSVGMSSRIEKSVCFFFCVFCAKVNSCITPIYCRSVTMCQWADVWLF